MKEIIIPITFDKQDYTVICVLEHNTYSCHIKEKPELIFQTSQENRISNLALILLESDKKWGVKNIKSYGTKFQIGNKNIRLSFITPYGSKYWLWHFRKSSNFFTLRFCGIHINICEKDILKKLLNKISYE